MSNMSAKEKMQTILGEEEQSHRISKVGDQHGVD
jgi:hypothetical protein